MLVMPMKLGTTFVGLGPVKPYNLMSIGSAAISSSPRELQVGKDEIQIM